MAVQTRSQSQQQTMANTFKPDLRAVPEFPAVCDKAAFNMRWGVVRAVADLNDCAQFMKGGARHSSLPADPDALGNTDAQKKAVKRHKIAVLIVTVAFQKNVILSGYVRASQCSPWEGGQMHIIVNMIEKYFSEIQSVDDKLDQEIARDNMLNSIQWNKNTKPNDIWTAIQHIEMAYADTCPLTFDDKYKWVTKNAPKSYMNTIQNASTTLHIRHKNFSYDMTFKDLTSEINCQYNTFLRDGKEGKSELSLSNIDDDNNGGRQKGKKNKHGKKNDTNPKKKSCSYCGKDGHYKRDCPKFKKERSQMHCKHCDQKGHTKDTCFKLKPELKDFHGIRKLNQFGKGETNGGGENASTEGCGVTLAGLSISLMCVEISNDKTCVSHLSGEQLECMFCDSADHKKNDCDKYYLQLENVDIYNDKDWSYASDESLIEEASPNECNPFDEIVIKGDIEEESEEEQGMEYAFASANVMSFPNKHQLLLSPDVIIANSGCTKFSTGSKKGGYNFAKPMLFDHGCLILV